MNKEQIVNITLGRHRYGRFVFCQEATIMEILSTVLFIHALQKSEILNKFTPFKIKTHFEIASFWGSNDGLTRTPCRQTDLVSITSLEFSAMNRLCGGGSGRPAWIKVKITIHTGRGLDIKTERLAFL